VLDYADEMLPPYNIPYDYTSASMASIYYALGENEKAGKIMRAVAENCKEYLVWGASLKREQRKSVQRTMQQNQAILGYVLQNLNHYRQDELLDEFEPVYQQYAIY
jgi:hypothetical protein